MYVCMGQVETFVKYDKIILICSSIGAVSYWSQIIPDDSGSYLIIIMFLKADKCQKSVLRIGFCCNCKNGQY